jgi:hypothetical protein
MTNIHPENKGKGNGNAPQQLANLTPIYGKERAQRMQKASVESRMANKAVREALNVTAKQWKVASTELGDNMPSAIDVLKLQMLDSLTKGDTDAAVELAKVLAEYEQPKLARVDGVSVTMDAEGLSDEELEQRLIELQQ